MEPLPEPDIIDIEPMTIDQFAGATALIISSVGALLTILFSSRCKCALRLGFGEKCYLLDCVREPPREAGDIENNINNNNKKKDDKKDKSKNKKLNNPIKPTASEPPEEETLVPPDAGQDPEPEFESPPSSPTPSAGASQVRSPGS